MSPGFLNRSRSDFHQLGGIINMNKKNLGVKIGLFLLVIFCSVILTSAMDSAVASEFIVNQFTDFPPGEGAEDPAIATDSNNHIIITWEDPRYGDDNVFARIFDNIGNPLTNDFRVDQPPNIGSDPSIAVDSNDHFIITWEETRLDQIPENDDIFARIFDSTGNPLTNEYRVDQDTGTNEAGEPVIATDGNNNFIIAWPDYRSGHGDIFAIIANNPNQPPVIDSFTADPTNPDVGEEVTFTCTAYDPDGDTLLTYEWDFDGDGNVDKITSDGTVIHTYNISGTYQAICTVADNDGARVVSDPITISVTGWQTHYSCSQSCEAQCGGDIACMVECSQYWQDCCQDGLDICQPQCPLVDPPSVHRVGSCDQGCQAEAPLKISGSKLDVCFNYTGSVNILAGVLSDDFRHIWWLRPDCSLYSNYSQAVDSGNGLSCQGISMPVEGSYLFWLVSPVDISGLDWENGIYDLLFYQVP
jgi:PKD repeat protein